MCSSQDTKWYPVGGQLFGMRTGFFLLLGFVNRIQATYKAECNKIGTSCTDIELKGIVSRKFDILVLVSFESLEVSTPFLFYPFFKISRFFM
jgi:hypothetical protein